MVEMIESADALMCLAAAGGVSLVVWLVMLLLAFLVFSIAQHFDEWRQQTVRKPTKATVRALAGVPASEDEEEDDDNDDDDDDSLAMNTGGEGRAHDRRRPRPLLEPNRQRHQAAHREPEGGDDLPGGVYSLGSRVLTVTEPHRLLARQAPRPAP